MIDWRNFLLSGCASGIITAGCLTTQNSRSLQDPVTPTVLWIMAIALMAWRFAEGPHDE